MRKKNLFLRATTSSLMISTPQRVLYRCWKMIVLPLFMIKIRKSVQNIIRLDEVGSWKRTEMQPDDKAHAFAMTFKDRPLELGELAFGLSNNLRFVVPNRNESNKSRWKTCRFWRGAVGVLKVTVSRNGSQRVA